MARGSPPRVYVGMESWSLGGVTVFSANLVRGLRKLGIPAQVLLTEHDTELVQAVDAPLPRPSDVPFEPLPVGRRDGWGAHWGAMVRFLEERAPCLYLPNSDWRHSCVVPLLSDRVGVVGVVHSDDPLHYDHVSRLGRYWNAVVTVSRTVAEKTAALDGELARRIVTIPIGVEVAEEVKERSGEAGRALEIVYHGVLNQRQKRVLDLPAVMEALEARGVPARLTVAGSGGEEGALREASRGLVARGRMRFVGVLAHEEALRRLEEADVFLMTSAFEGMPNALLEAMGRGCVPVVTEIESGIPEVVEEGVSGYRVGVGDVAGFAERLSRLQREPETRRRLSRGAHHAVARGAFRAEAMAEAYARLFERVVSEARSGAYRRPRGTLSLPPREVAGIGLFPVDCPHVLEGVGRFPSILDRERFGEEMRSLDEARRPSLLRTVGGALRRRREARIRELRDFRVTLGLPYWVLTGVSVFCQSLVRGLQAEGIAAEILLTEQDTRLIDIPDPLLPLPAGIPVNRLPVGRNDGWGTHWGAMIRHLEERAPCVYVPNYDWRHSCVSPRLSSRVSVVGVLHSDDPLHYDHVARLGACWDAIVAVSRTIADRTAERHPAHASRLVTIPYGVAIPATCPTRRHEPGAPLRIVYHGVLNQHQKRILDLPQIVRALERRGVPVVLTLAGGGRDDARLRSESRDLVERGRVRFVGVVPNQEALGLLEENDAYVMTSEFEGLPNALLEAMGRGCVPVVTAIRSGIPELVRDGENGYLIPVGDIEAFAERFALLHREPARRERLSRSAHRTVSRGTYRAEDMVRDYLELFQRVLHAARKGHYRRRHGPLVHPPPYIDGIGLFPVDCAEVVPEGRFPSRDEVRDFRRQMGLLREARLPEPLRPAARFARRAAERVQDYLGG